MERPAQASVRGLIEHEGRVLLVAKRTDGGDDVWTVPGGRARIGEDPRDAVVREMQEETSLEVTVGAPIGVYSFTWEDGANGVVATVFDCEWVDGTVDITNNPEDEPIVGFEWATPDRLSTLSMLPEVRRIVVEHGTGR